MPSLTRFELWAIASITFLYVVVVRLYKQIEDLRRESARSPRLVEAVNRLSAKVLGADYPSEPVESVDDALRLINLVGSTIARHTPSLRRVLRLSICLDLEHFLERTDLTLEDLAGLEMQLAPQAFWPASGMIIEEWTTHTEVWDYSGRRAVRYQGEPQMFQDWFVLWEHRPSARNGEIGPPMLQVVVHESLIKFWALDGRSWQHGLSALSENVFVTIPLNDEALSQYLAEPERSDELDVAAIQRTWSRKFSSDDSNCHLRWYLTITDLVAHERR